MNFLDLGMFLAKTKKAAGAAKVSSGGACAIEGAENIIHYAVVVVNLLQIIVPIALIIWGTIDLLKGIIAGDDKKISAARKPFIQRLISAVIVFLIPWIVNFAITTFVSDATAWKGCYTAATDATGLDSGSVSSNPGEQ